MQRWIHTGIKGCTFHYQPSMPRLPIPTLEKTIERYLQAVAPILSGEEFKKTEALASAFLHGNGKKLDAALRQRDEADPSSSFVHSFWQDMYLREMRQELMIKVNAYLEFKDSEKHQEWHARAGALCHSAFKFIRAVDNQVLEPDVYHTPQGYTNNPIFKRLVNYIPSKISYFVAYAAKGYPLDMKQYQHLFGTTRIPGSAADSIKKVDRRAEKSHIAVLTNGRCYELPLANEAGQAYPPAVLAASLREIHAAAAKAGPGPNMGVLTTLNRDKWAEVYAQFREAAEDLFECVESSAFVLTLADPPADSEAAANANANANTNANTTTNAASLQNALFLHGYARDRWFDKCFNLVIRTDTAAAAVSFEHSWGDGVCVLRMCNEIMEDHQGRWEDALYAKGWPTALRERGASSTPLAPPLQAHLAQAQSAAVSLIQQLSTTQMIYPGLGKQFLNPLNLSHDFVCQFVLQAAWQRLHRPFVGTYESASTAGFRAGRTETMRPLTQEMAALARQLGRQREPLSWEELEAASRRHKALTLQAATGQGFDRHLWAMSKLPGGGENEPLFTDDAWLKLNRSILSTSTLSSPYLAGGGFGPVVPDIGYGVGYSIDDDRLGFSLAGWQGEDDLRRFAEALESCAQELHAMLLEVKKTKA